MSDTTQAIAKDIDQLGAKLEQFRKDMAQFEGLIQRGEDQEKAHELLQDLDEIEESNFE